MRLNTSVIPALAPAEGWQMNIAKAHQLLSWSMYHGYIRMTLPSLIRCKERSNFRMSSVLETGIAVYVHAHMHKHEG